MKFTASLHKFLQNKFAEYTTESVLNSASEGFEGSTDSTNLSLQVLQSNLADCRQSTRQACTSATVSEH